MIPALLTAAFAAVLSQAPLLPVADHRVVSLQYTLTDSEGKTLDSASDLQPLVYIHGTGQLLPALEKVLDGRHAGDKLSVVLEPADAYGEHDSALVQKVPRSALQGTEAVKVGMTFQAETANGLVLVTVTRVAGDTITLDANHPLAGKTVTFALEIAEVREARPDELEHAHDDGHQH